MRRPPTQDTHTYLGHRAHGGGIGYTGNEPQDRPFQPEPISSSNVGESVPGFTCPHPRTPYLPEECRFPFVGRNTEVFQLEPLEKHFSKELELLGGWL